MALRSLRGEEERGFSLVEVVVSLGIIAFAVIAIYGLFPVGYRAGLDSRRETQATYIAEQLIGDLRAASSATAPILYGTDPASPKTFSIDLRTAGTYYLAADSGNVLIGPSTSGNYENSTQTPNVSYLTSIKIDPNTGFDNLTRVEVEVSAPAEAPLKNRSRFGIVTFIGIH
jgi:prepilin-type N-terminal cleavage/methylation domain-containing protein